MSHGMQCASFEWTMDPPQRYCRLQNVATRLCDPSIVAPHAGLCSSIYVPVAPQLLIAGLADDSCGRRIIHVSSLSSKTCLNMSSYIQILVTPQTQIHHTLSACNRIVEGKITNSSINPLLGMRLYRPTRPITPACFAFRAKGHQIIHPNGEMPQTNTTTLSSTYDRGRATLKYATRHAANYMGIIPTGKTGMVRPLLRMAILITAKSRPAGAKHEARSSTDVFYRLSLQALCHFDMRSLHPSSELVVSTAWPFATCTTSYSSPDRRCMLMPSAIA